MAIALLIASTFTHVSYATTCAQAIAISATLPATGNIVCGTADDINDANSPASPDPDDEDFKGGNEALYTFTPTTSGIYVISLGASASSWTSIWVFNGCPTDPASTFVAVAATSSGSKTLAVSLTAGTTYYIMFDTYPSPSSVCEDGPATYTVDVAPPPPTSCATLLTPANSATNVTLNPAPTFSWTAVAGATGYEFYQGTTPGSMTLLGSTTATNVAVTGNAPNTTYYWYVVPFNDGGSASGCNTSMSSYTTGALTNDDCAGAIAVSAMGGFEYVSVTGATESLSGCAGDATADVWYKVTTDNAGDLTITAETDGTDLVLEVFHRYMW